MNGDDPKTKALVEGLLKEFMRARTTTSLLAATEFIRSIPLNLNSTPVKAPRYQEKAQPARSKLRLRRSSLNAAANVTMKNYGPK